MAGEIEVVTQIANFLSKAKIPYFSEPRINGVAPDFLLGTPDGKKIILETKNWEPTNQNKIRAVKQAKYYKKATGADGVYIVLQGLKTGDRDKGLLGQGEIEVFLGDLFPKEKSPDLINYKIVDVINVGNKKKTIFAAMPFEAVYDDTYFNAMVPAADSVKAVCERTDQMQFTGDIIAKLKQRIEHSDAVIVDLSESRPNVLYEAGFAHALNRPTIHVSSTALKDLPFDVSTWSTISYNKGQTYKLKALLTERLRAIVPQT